MEQDDQEVDFASDRFTFTLNPYGSGPSKFGSSSHEDMFLGTLLCVKKLRRMRYFCPYWQIGLKGGE